MLYRAMESLSSDNHSPYITTVDDEKNSPGVQLPSSYRPTPYCVICGRGKDCFNHVGNRRFRVFIDIYQERYAKADTKIQKGQVVTEVWETIHSAGGRFVKYQGGAWYEVSEAMAREKIGSQFREALHAQYKSSSKSKLAKRRRQRSRRIIDLNSIPLERTFEMTNSRPQSWPNLMPIVEPSNTSADPSTWSENSSVVSSSNVSNYDSSPCMENTTSSSVLPLVLPSSTPIIASTTMSSDAAYFQDWHDRKPPPGWNSNHHL